MGIKSLLLKKMPTLKDVPLADRLKISVGPEDLQLPVELGTDEIPLELEPGDQPGVLTDGAHYMISEVDGRPKFISQERLKDCTGVVLFGVRKDPPHEPVSMMTHEDSHAVLGSRERSSLFFRDLEVRIREFAGVTRPFSRQALILGGMIDDDPEIKDRDTKIYLGAVAMLTKVIRRNLRIEPYVPLGPYRPQYDSVRGEGQKDGTALALYTRQKIFQLQRKAFAAPSDFGFSGSNAKEASKRFGGPPERYPKPPFMRHSSQWWDERDKRESDAYHTWADEINTQIVLGGRVALTRDEMFELSWKEARDWAARTSFDPKLRYTAEEYRAWLDSIVSK